MAAFGVKAPELNADFRDLLAALAAAGADFVVVGAFAVAHHGAPRATGDLDVFVRPTAANGARVARALRAFGAPLDDHGVKDADLARPGTIYQIGQPPRRIDVITEIDGVSFDEAIAEPAFQIIDGRRINFIGRAALLRNKIAAGRPKDLADVSRLVGASSVRPPRAGQAGQSSRSGRAPSGSAPKRSRR